MSVPYESVHERWRKLAPTTRLRPWTLKWRDRLSEQTLIADRILEEVRRSPKCELDALVLNLPEFTWQEVLTEVHRLSETGEITLTSSGAGFFTVSFGGTKEHK